MLYFVIIVAVICIILYAWAVKDYKKEKKKAEKEGEKSVFRSENDLEEYAKPMKDGDQNTVDMDDAE